jgi:repressor of nif and glnA expression
VIQEIKFLLNEEKSMRVKKKQKYTARMIYKILKRKGVYKGSERRIQYAVKRLREEEKQSNKQSFYLLRRKAPSFRVGL